MRGSDRSRPLTPPTTARWPSAYVRARHNLAFLTLLPTSQVYCYTDILCSSVIIYITTVVGLLFHFIYEPYKNVMEIFFATYKPYMNNETRKFLIFLSTRF